jgi:spermidine synthase
MYHVLSTGFTALLLYLISYFFCRIGYYSLSVHTKIWNLILAFAFFLTAAAGVFLALQINYKWNIPFIKEILKWHVESGIGLSITGLIHFIRHLKYYGKIFSKSSETAGHKSIFTEKCPDIRTNLFITGFTSSSVQFIMMREIMNITGGYELITGLFLGSWLIGSAIGASLASESDLNDIRKINLVFSLSPIFSLLLMLFLARVFLSPGVTPSLLTSMIYTFLVLIPYCMVSGFTFIKLINIAASENNFMPGKSFSIETAGGIISGIIISVLTAGLVNSYKLFLVVFILSFAYVFITFYTKQLTLKRVSGFIFLCSCLLIILLNPDIFFRQILMPSVKVTETHDTPYGNVTKGRYRGEESLYYNHRLLAYSDDATEREEDIHYAMLQSESPRRVLLISGSLRSHLPEILKYPVSKVTYIERDPFLAGYDALQAEDSAGKIEILNKDAFRYIRTTTDSYDVIVLLVPPPTTLLLNRYYTSEFFSTIRERLNPGGVFLCSPGPGDNYLNNESLKLYSSIYNSLEVNFRNIKPVIGNKLYFIASDKQISLNLCQLVTEKNIMNIYVNSDFLNDERINIKSKEVTALIDHGIKQNKSAFPVASFHSQSYQFSKNIDEKIPAIILMFMAFVLPVTAIKRKNLLMYFSASALAGFEIVILLTLQLTSGNLYQLNGLVIAGLMAGLAAGSGINIRLPGTFSLRNKVIILIVFYIFFGMVYDNIPDMKSSFLATVVIMFSGFIPAFFTGSIFRELTGKSDGVSVTPSVYSADLTGSAFGFIFITGVSIPLLGIRCSVYLLAALILGGILFGTIRNKV